MTGRSTGNNKYLKELNQAVILDLIRIHRSISKAELSKITGLSPTAIGIIVSGLLQDGYIHETGTGESRGGRRPVMIELKPRSFYSIGVDLDVNYVNIMLVDITGSIIHEGSIQLGGDISVEAVMNTISGSISAVLRNFSIGTDKLLGIGISVAGMVDVDSRNVILAPNLGWENADIRQYFKEFEGIPVFVENEAMASAICENWIGSCQGIRNFICINVKSGVGAGIYIDGNLYRGSGGNAGEIGHITVDENGQKCGCGNYGCLETFAATSRLVERAVRLVKQGTASSLSGIEIAEDITIDSVVDAARAGDDAAKSILNEAARYLGIAISNIVNTLNPSRIVIGKDFIKYADLVLDVVKGVVENKALKASAAKVEIMASEAGEKVSALGAAIIPLKAIFGR